MLTKLLVVAFAAVLLLGCTQQAPAATPHASVPVSTGTVQASTPSSQTVSVDIASFAFSQTSLTVSPGTTVVWTNKDSAPHTVTSDSGAFDSGSLSQGQTFSKTFNDAGTFAYHCTFHGAMKATVTVQ